MALEDILPIASILLLVIGFIIMLIGFICLANIISKEESTTRFSNTEDIIGEMNQMLTYFTDKIQVKHEKEALPAISSQNEYYLKVVEYKKQGKTPDQIAKELNIGKGEVNLILGIDQMR